MDPVYFIVADGMYVTVTVDPHLLTTKTALETVRDTLEYANHRGQVHANALKLKLKPYKVTKKRAYAPRPNKAGKPFEGHSERMKLWHKMNPGGTRNGPFSNVSKAKIKLSKRKRDSETYAQKIITNGQRESHIYFKSEEELNNFVMPEGWRWGRSDPWKRAMAETHANAPHKKDRY